jgi:methylated-DNA-[protein]-cysteine S-methyltransferase
MSPTISSCRAIQPDLVATATGDARPGAEARVEAHVSDCAPCRRELERYRSIDRIVADIRRAPMVGDRAEIARGDLEYRLAELRRRAVTARTWDSPIGPLLIAKSEQGVVLVEYLESARGATASRALRRAGVEILEDVAETETFYQQILEYLAGERTRLGWPLDYRLATSDFQREVLQVTGALPYGAVTSYARLAREMGRPTATRAVAQALRHNPLPLVVPCHRVVGGTGALTGYAGDNLPLKERLLALEGVPVAHTRRQPRIAREAMYVRADHDTEYCVPSCGSLSTLPLWRLTLFGSRERAESSGLAPCSACRPDLHPISA